MARNRTAVANGDMHPDWVELYNPGSADKDLGGYCLTSDLADPARFQFPPGVTVPAHGFLVVWCDHEPTAPGLHTGFALAASGEILALFAPSTNGLVLQDLLTFGLQLTDLSLGRSPDGSTNWTLNLPTPNTPNQAQPLGNPAKLKVNKWMANPATGDPWFELYNDDAGRLLSAHPIGLDRRIEQRRNESNYVILITKSAVALWLPCVHFWFSGSP